MDGRLYTGVLLVIVAALGVGILMARSQHGVAAPAATAVPTALPEPAPNHVNIVEGASGSASYNPPTLLVSVGATVTFTNTSNRDETATADGGAFDTGVLSPGESKTWVPAKAGTYGYSSYIDPGMHGVIAVQP